MREDQRERLNDLSERLADVFLNEADPDNWSGAGKLPSDMTKDERGNRHWDRKGAIGTAAVLRYTIDLISWEKGNRINDPAAQSERDDELDDKIAEAERRAERAAARVLAKAKKTCER
ncbi:hypothetical protein [Burkholderia contaminans]|uniref:hypothetical protein n=1 Tax=Burkholderia contaminans TaxID=488447 RepID=UPI001454B0D0|nr:hypothetical protein [Burkholderia contaminans]VWD22457.1 hypothetical protein BCO18442_04023 [Burkholderia contaminans]